MAPEMIAVDDLPRGPRLSVQFNPVRSRVGAEVLGVPKGERPAPDARVPNLSSIDVRNADMQRHLHRMLDRAGYHKEDPMRSVIRPRYTRPYRESVIVSHDQHGDIVGALRHSRHEGTWGDDPENFQPAPTTVIHDVRVHSSAAGQGHGQKLIDAAAHHAARYGTNLEVHGVVNSARGFYESSGAYNPWVNYNPNVTDELRWRTGDVEKMAARHLGAQFGSRGA